MVRKLAEQPDQLLKTLAHEELGLSEQTFRIHAFGGQRNHQHGYRRSCAGASFLFLDRTEGIGYFVDRQQHLPILQSARRKCL